MTAENAIPRRELVTLLSLVEWGSHRRGARHLGISESCSRQRVSSLLARLGVESTAQAVWVLRDDLAAEMADRDGKLR